MSNFTKQPVVRVSVRYGLIAGVFGFALMIALYYMNRHPMLVSLFFDFRILLFSILIIFSLKEIRDYYQEGILYFWQAMIGSFLLTLTFAVVCSLLIYLFALWNSEFVTSFISLGLAQVKTLTEADIEQMGKQNYDAMLAAMPTTSAFSMARRFFFQSFIISFFLSIIISVILRRQPKSQ
jgi:hypothetical protein